MPTEPESCQGTAVARHQRVAFGHYWGNGKLWDRDFSNATKIEMPHWGNNFALEAQLAVYAGGAISSGIELAELEKQLAEMDWQKNRQDIRFLLVGHYLNLYKLTTRSRCCIRIWN